MLAHRRVKIVGTLGPSTSSRESLLSAMKAGLNVARMNFSHGSHESHLENLRTVRALSQEYAAPVTVLQDLQGPKVRVGKFEGGGVDLKSGEQVILTMRPVMGGPGLIPSDFPQLAMSVGPGSRILLDDGRLELRVNRVDGTEVECEVVFGGRLKDRKGMNCPGSTLRADALTDKDLQDLQFGLLHGVDYVALSFVRSGKDIRKLRELIDLKNPQVRICAKIEMLEATQDLEEIIRLSDSVMVARGDLAVEIGQSRLPGVQKQIIRLCNEMGKPVITATQMLESMIESPTPTRAEITDVANAVWDGSDALMLSAETASGKYPTKCIQTMHEIICEVESQQKFYRLNLDNEFLSIAEAVGASASLSALKVSAEVIVCLTTTGRTANIISSTRPKARIVAVTDQLPVLNRLELCWGVSTFPIRPYKNHLEVQSQVEELLLTTGMAKPGDRVVMTFGTPMSESAKTNTLHVFHLKDQGLKLKDKKDLPLRCQ